jgi:hypothetical protein
MISLALVLWNHYYLVTESGQLVYFKLEVISQQYTNITEQIHPFEILAHLKEKPSTVKSLYILGLIGYTG